VGGLACEFGVVVFVEYVGIGKVSVCSRGTSHGDHGCGGSGKLWKVCVCVLTCPLAREGRFQY